MSAHRAGHGNERLARLAVARRRILDRTACLQVHRRRPVRRNHLLRGEQLARRAIEHIEEPVLRHLHDHFAIGASDLQRGQHQRLGRREIPRFAGRGLVVPDVFPGVCLQRDDRRQIQIVAAAGAAIFLVPGRAIAGADVDEVELRVVDERIPDGAATPIFHHSPFQVAAAFSSAGDSKPFAGSPGTVKKTPRQLARLGVIRRDVAAHAHLRAAVTNEHFAFHHTRRTRDGVAKVLVDGELFPDRLAGGGIERNEAAIQRAHVDLAVPSGDSTVGHVTARVHTGFAGNLRVIRPDALACSRVEREHLAPRARDIHHAIDHERGGLLHAMRRVEIERPREAELLHVLRVDLLQRAESLLVVSAAIAHPVRGILVRVGRGGRHRLPPASSPLPRIPQRLSCPDCCCRRPPATKSRKSRQRATGSRRPRVTRIFSRRPPDSSTTRFQYAVQTDLISV